MRRNGVQFVKALAAEISNISIICQSKDKRLLIVTIVIVILKLRIILNTNQLTSVFDICICGVFKSLVYFSLIFNFTLFTLQYCIGFPIH